MHRPSGTLPTGGARVAAGGNNNSSLMAPPMSISSSRASTASEMWSAGTSRRDSNASSVAPPSAADLASALSSAKLDACLAAAGGAPMAVSASEGGYCTQARTQTTPASARRPLKHTTDPLERTYPKPAADIDIGAALAREPLKWSLGHWKKNARDVARAPPSADASRRRFEDVKDELRRAQQDLAPPKTSR